MKFWEVAAFTGKEAAGNPAGVCLLQQPASVAWMQACAARLAYSETAYLMPCGDTWSLRWFSPLREVDLCGHATLASAHLLFSGRLCRDSLLRFETLSGVLSARQTSEGIELDFPAITPQFQAVPQGLLKALGMVSCVEGFRGGSDFCIAVEDSNMIFALKPDLEKLSSFDIRGLCVTAPAAPGAQLDFVSRFFAPHFGIPEDPVTGSVHCLLGPYWEARLHRSNLRAFQASARGGYLKVAVEGARVKITGQARTLAVFDLPDEGA